MTWRFPWEGDDPTESRALRHIGQQVEQVLTNQETLMATVEDLSAAAAAATATLNQAATDLQTLIGAGVGGIQPTDLDPVLSAVTDLGTAATNLDAAITAAIPAS